jgi:hypothetical protein
LIVCKIWVYIMDPLKGLILLITIIFSTACAVGLFIAILFRYRVKKTPITKSLIILQVYFTLTTIISLITAFIAFFDIPVLSSENDVLTLDAGNSALVLAHTFFFQLAVLFALPTFYYFYVFARIVFFPEEEKGGKFLKWVRGLIVGTIAIQVVIISLLLYAIVRSLAGLSPNSGLLILGVVNLALIVAILKLACFFSVTIPVLFNSLRLWKNVAQDNPYKSNLFYITVMALFTILQGVFNIIDVFLLQAGFEHPTLAHFLLWFCIPVIEYATYRGFSSSKSGKLKFRSPLHMNHPRVPGSQDTISSFFPFFHQGKSPFGH